MSYSRKAIGANHSPLELSPLSTESKPGVRRQKEIGRDNNKEDIYWGETEAFISGKTETTSTLPQETFRLSLTPALTIVKNFEM